MFNKRMCRRVSCLRTWLEPTSATPIVLRRDSELASASLSVGLPLSVDVSRYEVFRCSRGVCVAREIGWVLVISVGSCI